jgi:hypothetical protein
VGIGRLLRGILRGGGALPAGDAALREGDPEQRRAPRVEKLGWARYESGEVAGQGLVTNLSQSGALVERCSAPLLAGAKVVLRLKPAGGHPSVELEAEVVRATRDSFALRFTAVGEEAASLLAEMLAPGAARG